MDPGFLFAAENSISRLSSRRLFLCGCVLILCGIVSMVIATICSVFEATKKYHLEFYVNTHWITTTFVFAGLSVYCMERHKRNFYLYLSIIFCLIGLPISFGSFITDCVNLHYLRQLKADVGSGPRLFGRMEDSIIIAMKVYAALDLVVCAVAGLTCALILLEIRQMSSRYFQSEPEFKSRWLFGCSVALVIVSLAKLVVWLKEIVWLRVLGPKGRHIFLHYTLDEPVWNMVFVFTGILTALVALRGSRILMHAAMIINVVSFYPCFFYLWIDWKWHSAVQHAQAAKLSHGTTHQPGDNHHQISISFAMLHLAVILATLLVQWRLLSRAGERLFALDIDADATLRRCTIYTGVLLLAASVAFIVSDIANLIQNSFFRVFYATDQKLPFVTLLCGVLCLLCLRKNLSLYVIPLTFLAFVLVIHTAVFHVASYLYLALQRYFSNDLCTMFTLGPKRCQDSMEITGTWSHFFEAAMALAISFLCLLGAILAVRVMSTYKLSLGHMSFGEQSTKKRAENAVLVIGIISLVLGLVVLVVSVGAFINIKGDHPLVVLHSYVYRTCLCLALIIYPIIQICLVKNLLFYPMKTLTIISCCVLRFVEISIHLDYRNIGQSLGLAWTLFSTVEILSLFLNFATICLCGTLIDIGINRIPEFNLEIDISEKENEETADRIEQTQNTEQSTGVLTDATNNFAEKFEDD